MLNLFRDQWSLFVLVSNDLSLSIEATEEHYLCLRAVWLRMQDYLLHLFLRARQLAHIMIVTRRVVHHTAQTLGKDIGTCLLRNLLEFIPGICSTDAISRDNNRRWCIRP